MRILAPALAVAFVAIAVTHETARAQSVADSAWAMGNVALAEQLYETQIVDGAATQRTLHRLALIRAWSDRFDSSLDLFNELVEAAPDNVEAALDRAKVLSWQNDLEGAAAAYRRVSESHPDSREARLGLARVLSWSGDMPGAETVYLTMLEADAADAEALAGHARMAAWLGDLAEAERRWRRALDLHPNDVVLLTGLGATLRWQGLPSAAVEVLERALALSPDDEEARQEYRLARLSVAPRLGPSLAYETDSDGNRIATLWHDQTMWPSGWLAINTNAYARTSQLAAMSSRAYGGLVELRFRIANGWEIDAGAGVNYSPDRAATSKPQWRARVATPGSLPVQLWARHWRRALDETAPLIRNGVELSETSLGVRGTVGRTRAEASFSFADYRASEANRRRGLMLSASHRVGGPWTLGAALRGFSFEEDRNDGYFDPDVYGLVEIQIGWAKQISSWHLGLTASPGVQKVGRGTTSVSGSARLRSTIGYEFGPGQLVSLHSGYSSAGLRSFSTGNADYRYFSTALAVGWAF